MPQFHEKRAGLMQRLEPQLKWGDSVVLGIIEMDEEHFPKAERAFNSASPWAGACQLLCPWDFPGKNTEVDCHFFLQIVFLTQGWNLHLL